VAWCENDDSPSLKLITAPAGVGKTRLALHLMERMTELGWSCYRVADGRESTVLEDIRSANSGRILLVVDYAETRSGLFDLLQSVPRDRGAAVRVLLLSRSAGPWWEQLAATDPAIRDLVTKAGPRGETLAQTVDSDKDSQDLVENAASYFAAELGVASPTVTILPSSREARILELHAAALVAVLDTMSESQRETTSLDIAGVLDELLRHEERFWIGSASKIGIMAGTEGVTPGTIRQLVAALVLLGASDKSEAIQLLSRVEGMPTSPRIAEWLRDLYPPDNATSDWMGSLKPDRVRVGVGTQAA